MNNVAICIDSEVTPLPRFFLPQQSIDGGFLVLTGENAVHAKVLRLKSGDEVVVCDGLGRDYRCTVSDVSAGQVSLVVRSAGPSGAEPAMQVSVFMAYAKSDKLEHVIQKATELGAVEIVAFPSARCVSRPDDKSLAKKLERWQKIAASAAEQCGRGRIPAVRAAATFAEAVAQASAKPFSAFLYENEQDVTFRSLAGCGPFPAAAVMTGPEGGFAPSEVELAKRSGMQICTLGPRILRCETAPLCALTALMFACGELD